ncbi:MULTISPECIES: hypothetical protein [Tenacibaculum]|uniref:hypothetical protein n=1 Tax=Tenacibaculum TaxID=104267 RepID=UPI001F26F6CF|nr:hypothetical protein [Tenacibaculum piscium]
MKKTLILTIIIIVFTSCHFPYYRHSGNVNSSLDFRKGKWLLNNIEAPKGVGYILTEIADEKFSELLNERFSTVPKSKGILIPMIKKNSNNLSKSTLKDIKNGTGFDFFINIKAKQNKNEIDDLQIGSVDSDLENNVEISIEIYDLNLLERFYFHSVIAGINIKENNQDFAFAKGTENLIIKGFEKIMKKIKKNEIKN